VTPADLPETARAILHALLDCYEQPDRRNVMRVRLIPRDHPAYFSAEDPAPRHTANQALRRLADAGALRLRWRKWEEGNWLEAVDLVAEQAPALYALLGREPRGEQDQALHRLLDAQRPHPGWHARFLAWVRAQLGAHRSVAPLDRADPQHNADLLRALAALATLREPALERTLSVRLFSDSKRMEKLRGDVLRVLRAHDPEAGAFGDDEWALLRAHNLDRVPEYVPVAGPLLLWAPERAARPDADPTLDLTPLWPSVALSATMLRTVEVAACDARWLVTVENPTSFTELLKLRPPYLLAVYTGGFASPAVIQLLRAVCAARPDLPLLHWGDMDAGGLRILAHLRRQVGGVAALAMDPAVFAAHRAFALPLTPGDRTALAALRALPALSDRLPLIDALLEAGQKLEQEAVGAAEVLRMLSAQA